MIIVLEIARSAGSSRFSRYFPADDRRCSHVVWFPFRRAERTSPDALPILTVHAEPETEEELVS